MINDTCTVEDCNRDVKVKKDQLCGAHYQQKSKGKPFTKPKAHGPKVACVVERCEKLSKAKGLCNAHYQQSITGKNFKDPRQVVHRHGCDVEGCIREHASLGYCDLHYARFKRNGSPLDGKNGELTTCSVDECHRAARSRGMCSMHFKREWRGELRHEVTCAHCGETKPAKLPNRTYCSPSCASRGNYQLTKDTRAVKTNPLSTAYRDGDHEGVIRALKDRCEVDSNGCWVWRGRLNEHGYATTSVAGKNRAVHRVSLEAKIGHKLGKIQAHHMCAQSSCVNPEHLQPAHHRDNIAEMQIRVSLEARINQLEDELRRLDPSNNLIQ